MKIIFTQPYRTHSTSLGRIAPDGSLSLVQRVDDEGKPVHERRWSIHEVGPGRFVGTMSEASGPVAIEVVDGRYRFRFTMKGHVSIEQWLWPFDGGKAAHTVLAIRKFGMAVASGEATIRKVS